MTTEPARSPISRRNLVFGGAAGLAAPFLLAGCGDPRVDEPSTGGSAAAPTSGGINQITFLAILPMTSLTFTPEYVAVAEGMYEAEGLKVDFQTTRGSAPAIQAILNNQGHVTRIGDIETLNAVLERDAPLLAIARASHKAPMRLMSASGKPIKTPQDMKGMKIGLPSAGGTSEVTLDLVGIKGGLKKGTDYTTQVVGGFSPASFDMVKSGRLDGLIVSMDMSVIIQSQHPDAVILNPGQYLESGAQVYATNTSIAQQNPDTMKNYLAATKKAMQFVADDAPDFQKTMDAIKKSGYKVAALDTPELVKKTLPLYIENWQGGLPADQMLSVSEEDWQKGYEEAAAAGLLKKDADLEGSLTGDYLPT